MVFLQHISEEAIRAANTAHPRAHDDEMATLLEKFRTMFGDKKFRPRTFKVRGFDIDLEHLSMDWALYEAGLLYDANLEEAQEEYLLYDEQAREHCDIRARTWAATYEQTAAYQRFVEMVGHAADLKEHIVQYMPEFGCVRLRKFQRG